MAAIKSIFSDAGIMKKALVGPLVMLIFMIASGAFALTSLSSVGERMSYASLELTPATGAATDLMSAMFRERLAAEAFLANNTQERFEQWRAVHADTNAAAKLAVERFAGSSRAETVERAVGLQREYARTFADEVAPRRLEIVSIRNETLDPRSEEATDLLRFVGNVVPELQARTGRILQQIVQTELAVERFLRTAEQTDEQRARDAMAQVKLDIDMAAATANGMTGSSDNDFLPDAIEQSKVAAEAWAAYVDAFDRAAQLTHAAREATEGAMASAGPAMTDAARELQGSIFAELAELGSKTTTETGNTLMLLVGVLVAAAAIGLAVAVIVTRGVVRPLLLTNERIDKMLREIDAGHGDLTQRLPVNSRDEVGQLAANFNRFVETLQKVVGRIGEETNRLAGAAAKLSAVTSQTSSGVQRQNSETDQVATAMTQMTATVQEIARNASEASVAAADANQSASQGRRTVEATVDAIQELVDLLENGAGTVTRVSEDVEAITSILDVIRGIAEQTNLLALNAAIEAARAGEQGRGFAVVADEVRDLAQKTQSSTGRIQALIENLQNGARSAVDAMNEGRSQGQRTVGHAAEAGEALQRIDRKVQAINDMNAQIASAAEEQTAVSNDIAASVERIRQIAAETGAGAGETASSSEELARLGERLKTLVGQFRV